MVRIIIGQSYLFRINKVKRTGLCGIFGLSGGIRYTSTSADWYICIRWTLSKSEYDRA